MITVFYGTDTLTIRQAARDRLATLVDQGYQMEQFSDDVPTTADIARMVGSVSLFGAASVYLLDQPSDSEEFWEAILASVTDLLHSSNHLIIIERGLLAPAKKKLGIPGVEMHECMATVAKSSFDPFLINDALLAKDKKSLWVLLQRARLQGIPVEETIGILWWQLKSLRLVAMSASAAMAGMKSYPYDKTKRSLRNFKPGEVESLSRTLLRVYHDGRGGVKDIDNALEEWVLQA